MNETPTGRTTREITFDDASQKTFTFGTRKPAGTEVYARLRKDGTFDIRIPGTLLTQNVYASAIEGI